MQRSVRKDKQRFLSDCLAAGDWDAVTRCKKPFTPKTTRLRDIHGNLVSTADMADAQAEYYATYQWNPPPPPPHPPPLRPPLFPPSDDILTGPFDHDELRKALGLLKTKKAAGPDGIPNEIWKMLTTGMVETATHGDEEKFLTAHLQDTLLHLINRIHLDREMPDIWNEAHIAALFKR